MSVENFPQKDPVNSQEPGILKNIRRRADALINLGFLQTRLWMITTGITIIAATCGIEFSGDLIKKFKDRNKTKNS